MTRDEYYKAREILEEIGELDLYRSKFLSGRVEYRPCIVQNEKGRGCEYKKALFHCWDFRSELYGASPLIGGHSAGQVSGTFGIVEYEDGTVHEVLPTQIRFVDREIKNYAFCVDEKELKEDGRQSSCVNS